MSAISKNRAGVISSIESLDAAFAENLSTALRAQFSEMAGRKPVEADFAHLGEAAFREFRKAVGRWERAKKKAEADCSSGGEQLLQQALAATLVVQQSWIVSNVPDIAGSLEVGQLHYHHEKRQATRRLRVAFNGAEATVTYDEPPVAGECASAHQLRVDRHRKREEQALR